MALELIVMAECWASGLLMGFKDRAVILFLGLGFELS